MKRLPLWYGLVVAVAVVLDQIAKYAVVSGMSYHQEILLLPVLSLFRTSNTGIAFSMLPWLGDYGLILLMLAVIGFVLYLWRAADPRRIVMRFGFALVLGGAVGNLIDRIAHGHVIDFILFHVGGWSFAVFNLADSFITIGAVLVILDEALLAPGRAGHGGPGARPGSAR